MPVSFQQPSPMAPDVSIGGGRAQVATADFGALAQMYDAANRNQLQASQATAQMGLQASEAGAQLSQRQGELAVHQQDAAAARQERMQMLAVEGAQRQQDQQQRAGLQAWLSQQELSQHEQMHMQRLESARSQVLADPNLKPEEKMETLRMINEGDGYGSGLDILKQRQEMGRAKMMQQQQQDMVQHSTMLAAGQKAMDEFWSGAKDGVKWVQDPDTGERHGFLRGPEGRPIQVKSEKGGGEQKSFDIGHAVTTAKHLAEALGIPPTVGTGEGKAPNPAHAAFLREEARKANYKHNETAKNPDYRFELEPERVQQAFKDKYGDDAAKGWEQEHRTRLLAEKIGAKPPSHEPTTPAPAEPKRQGGLTDEEKNEKAALIAEQQRILREQQGQKQRMDEAAFQQRMRQRAAMGSIFEGGKQ